MTLKLEMHSADLSHPAVLTLLQEHLASMSEHSPAESIHALKVDELAASNISFWCAWHGAELAGCGALKELGPKHGEIKTMRTSNKYLRQGVAAAVLLHILTEAKNRGYQKLSLETGSAKAFLPAQKLYKKYGFQYCQPFADYKTDPFSVFMSKPL